MFHALMTIADESVRQMQHNHSRLLQSMARPPAGVPDQPHPAQIPLRHLSALHGALGDMGARQVHLCHGLLASLLKPVPDASVLLDLMQMQQVVLQRLSTLQNQFMADLGDLMAGAATVGRANTVSKLMDQEYDLVARFNALVVAQFTALLELTENVQVNAGYLLTRKAEDAGF